ncbi:ATP-binding cassette domain-containing protein, partial [Brachyspira pilosicoli]|uniref:ATP-binding cassette domain-containing protein n=1 Tax=Brachyspira pilosicoli TaxID=52584 RepID=UPI001CA55EFC
VKLLNIKVGYNQNKIMNLSGGNQQKVCIARCLNCKPKVIILDEPTRGVDIGAKQEIHKIIDDLSKTGAAIILISSELQEIIGAADRIITLADGNITKEFNLVNNKVSQEDIILGALKEK